MALTPREREIVQYGIDNGKSVDETLQALERYRQMSGTTGATPQEELQSKSFGQDLKEDISGIQTGFTEDLEQRSDKFGAALETKNPLRRAFQQFGQGAGAVSDLIGNTVLGLGKAALPQAAEEAVGAGAQKVAETIASNPIAQTIAENYAVLKERDPALARDIDAALGIGMLGLDIGTAGLTGQAAKQVSRTAGAGLSAAGDVAAKTGVTGARLVADAQGTLVGTGGEAIEQAFRAGFEGGKTLDEFTRYLKDAATPEKLVETVRNNADVVKARRNKAFTDSLAQLGGERINTGNIIPELNKTLSEYGIGVENGRLLFGESKFSTVPSAQNKLQQAYDEISRLGSENSLQRIDTSRQALRNLELAGEDNAANTANAIITQAAQAVRKAGEQVDGYGKMLDDFGEQSAFLNELTRSLSIGDKANIETAFKKLTTSLKVNNEQRLELLKELDAATGGAILTQIAGQQLSEALPRGIIRQILAPVAAVGAIATGTIFTPQTFLALAGLSPRLAGEFAKTLGITGRKLTEFMAGLDKTRSMLKQLGIDPENIKIPLPSAIQQGVTEE